MLTSELLRVRVKGKQLFPRFVDPEDEELKAWAGELLGLFQAAVEERWRLEAILEATREMEGLRLDQMLYRGLAKVLLDRATFETHSPIPPPELRARAFALAATRGPLALEAGPTGLPTAATVLGELATELDTTAEALSEALYADLKEQQRLMAFEGFDLYAEDADITLLHRYNLALAQAVLLRASELTVVLGRPEPHRMRQLLRFARFFQLMFRARRLSTGAVELVFDGPQSLLQQSTRYGLQLATFLPALLLQPAPWRLEAEVMWGKTRKFRKTLELTHEAGLRGHYADRGAWTSRAEELLLSRLAELEHGWMVGPGTLLDLGDQRVLAPDLALRKDGRVAYVDIVGFWRKGYLEQRLKETPSHVILAVSKRLCGDKAALPATVQKQVVVFAEIINAKEIIARAEAVAIREPGSA